MNFKNCPQINLVPVARLKLLEKLCGLGEDTAADLWEQAWWAQKQITRVEANSPRYLHYMEAILLTIIVLSLGTIQINHV
jgi:hypothetical protein